MQPELEVSIRHRRWAYVIDPVLALASPAGAQLVQRLSIVAEVWMVRGFWQVLDASDYYRQRPLSLWSEPYYASLPQAAASGFLQALALWECIRTHTDLAGTHLHWLSDNLSESSLSESAPPQLLERYEDLHQTLTSHSDDHPDVDGTGSYAALDALALTAALGSARLLTLALRQPSGCLGQACERVGLPLQQAPSQPQEVLLIERQGLSELLVSAGASPLLWHGLQLAIVQLALPQLGLQRPAQRAADDDPLPVPGVALDAESEAIGAVTADPWQGACAYWYEL